MAEVEMSVPSSEREFSFISKPFKETELSFRVGGPIDRFEVYAGNYYQRGDIIAEIDSRDFRIRKERAEAIYNQAKALCENTGYDELSLASLSTSDHSDIQNMLSKLIDYTEGEHINLSLPSLRIDNFSEELLEKVKRVRKSGLTFAPEAGTQRLRDVINKNVSEEEIMNTCRIAFEGGYSNVKLYFMMGLPTERDEDIVGIAELAQRIIDFTSGATFAISGNLQKISNYIFLVTPTNVDISGDLQDLLNTSLDSSSMRSRF